MKLPWRRSPKSLPRPPDIPKFVPDLARSINDDLPAWKLRIKYVPTSRLLTFERRMRTQMPWWLEGYESDGKRFTPFFGTVKDPCTMAQLASIHRNGYIREAAVERLANDIDLDKSLRWLILRCFDRVPEVQHRALVAVSKAFREKRASYAAFAAAVSLLAADVKDVEVRELFTSILSTMLEPDNVGVLVDVARRSDVGASRKAVELLLTVQPALEVLRYVTSADAFTLRMIARQAFDNPSICESAALQIADRRNMSLRADGLWHLTSHNHEVPKELLERALNEQALLVRGIAQSYAKEIGYDLRSFYLGQLDSKPAAALSGLGDLATRADIELALHYEGSPLSEVRRAALRIVASFGDAEVVPLLIRHAITDAAAPSRQAIRGLTRLGIRRELSETYWSELVALDLEAGWRRFFRRILPESSRWVALEFGLRGCACVDIKVRGLAVECVESVISRVGESHLMPRPELVLELRKSLTAASSVLPKATVEELSRSLSLNYAV